MEEGTEFSTSGHDEYQRKNLCGCSNPRLGLLAAGATQFALGSVGLGLILLGPQNRHLVLYPLEEKHPMKIYSEEWEDTIQLLIEFWFPSLAYWILGAVLLTAAFMQRMSLLIFWVVISTLLLAGSIAGILGLLVAGASFIGLLPLIIATMLQMYFYYVISDMTYFHWRTTTDKPDDKEILVDSTV
ncbi:hypothetical protein Ocin01_00298 [Orchesella cincta]|uniref:Uncharacterized protein n=1 Tax=Orchesella cincta TaxID=48709 RepID=A0A1D2NME5_ORCCI|nr:hypothetical protein Ocin01_00298 [Orchesella cincta]